jgi:hypothetical protein
MHGIKETQQCIAGNSEFVLVDYYKLINKQYSYSQNTFFRAYFIDLVF